MALHSHPGEVTERIRLRSRDTRALYRERIARAGDASPRRAGLACGNLAQGFAPCSAWGST